MSWKGPLGVRAIGDWGGGLRYKLASGLPHFGAPIESEDQFLYMWSIPTLKSGPQELVNISTDA
jgi:hypothetical protein